MNEALRHGERRRETEPVPVTHLRAQRRHQADGGNERYAPGVATEGRRFGQQEHRHQHRQDIEDALSNEQAGHLVDAFRVEGQDADRAGFELGLSALHGLLFLRAGQAGLTHLGAGKDVKAGLFDVFLEGGHDGGFIVEAADSDLTQRKQLVGKGFPREHDDAADQGGQQDLVIGWDSVSHTVRPVTAADANFLSPRLTAVSRG